MVIQRRSKVITIITLYRKDAKGNYFACELMRLPSYELFTKGLVMSSHAKLEFLDGVTVDAENYEQRSEDMRLVE